MTWWGWHPIVSPPQTAHPKQPLTHSLPLNKQTHTHTQTPFSFQLRAVDDAEEVTKKWGLEAGLFSIFKSGGNKEGKAVQAKDLLAKYGSAYLVTSISLSLVSFSLCYVLISAGVDVPALLAKVGIQASSQTETAGTVALAYAAHKAASPIRFPPTVALTPFVANAIGKKPVEEGNEEQ